MGCAEIGHGPCQELEDKGLPTQGDSSREEFHTGSGGVHTAFSALNVLPWRQGRPCLPWSAPLTWNTSFLLRGGQRSGRGPFLHGCPFSNCFGAAFPRPRQGQ